MVTVQDLQKAFRASHKTCVGGKEFSGGKFTDGSGVEQLIPYPASSDDARKACDWINSGGILTPTYKSSR